MAANPLPKTMRVRLAEVGRRLRRQQIVQGVCRLVLTLLLAAGTAVLLDALVRLPGWSRGLLLAGWAALGIRGIRRFIRGPLSRPLDAEGLAAAVEREYPRLGERLTTAVELAGTDDPANGSPYLVDMLIRDVETRTGRLDLKRAAPATATLLVGLVSLLVFCAVLMPLIALPQATEHARRFFTPWRVPTVDVAYRIKVTSGDPTVKRGEGTTLSAVIEPARPDASIPSAATAVIRIGTITERTTMIFDDVKREAYLTRGAVEADFDYQIVAGDVQSEWHRVAVVDPVRIESAHITITPPAYARKPGDEPIMLDGLSDLAALQYSTIALELRFNRPPSGAWLDWKPYDEEAGRKAPPGRISIPHNGASTAVVAIPAVVPGVFRLHAEVARLKTAFREMPLRVAIDAPPKFERVAGLTIQPRAARPDEKAAVELVVSDDVGVSLVELEIRVNDGQTQVVNLPLKERGGARAEVSYVLDLAGLVKEGDRLSYRVAVSDNRYLPDFGLLAQKTYFPGDDKWSELRVSSSAAPLKEQEIAAQKKDVGARLQAILDALTKQQRTASRWKMDNAAKNVITLEQAGKLDDLRSQVVDTGEMLDELVREATLSPDLNRLGEAARDVADHDVRPAASALRQAQRDDKPGPRAKCMATAERGLEEAIRKVKRLLDANERIAQMRFDKHRLEDIADQQKNLAEQTAKAGKDDLEAVQAKQKELEDQLRKLREESEPLRQALRALQERQLEKTADDVRTLEQDVRDLTQAMKNAEQRSREGRLPDLQRRQQDLAQRANELARSTQGAARSAPLAPLQAQELDKAAEALKTGNLADAVEQQEKAAFELERLANELEKAVARARDPREAARQLERLQEDLRQQVAEAVKDTPLERLPVERRQAFEKQQQAIQKAAGRLSIPGDAAEAQASRKNAVGSAAEAGEALNKADAADADERMQKTREALARLAEQLPTQERRLALARAETARLRQEQDAIAALVERAVKLLDKLDPDAPATQRELARQAADLAKRQAQAADRLSKLDLPGHEDRQARAEEALRLAKSDLDAGRPQDVAPSQQAARRELERLEQAISGQTPADEQADRLAKRQKDLAEKMRQNARQPDAKRTRELQQLQAELSNDLRKLPAPEAPAAKEDALTLTRKAEDAKSAEEAESQAAAAARTLQRLADQVNGRDNEADKADRLAKKQKQAAEDADRLAKKKETSPEARKKTQQMLDEARHLRPGDDAQKDKQQALDALTRAQQANQPEQLARAQNEAAEALQRLADKLQPRPVADRPPPKQAPDEGPAGLPGKAQAEAARRLADEQRQLRDELARANEQMSKEPPALDKNPLEDLLKEEDMIAAAAEDLTKKLNDKPAATQARQSAAAARQTSGHLKNGELDQAKGAGRQTAQQLEQLGQGDLDNVRRQEARDLAHRQEEVNKKLEDLLMDPRAAKSQQAARQKQLQEQAKELSGQMQRLGQQMKQENPAAGGKAEEAAMHAQQAEEAIKMAREQSAKNEREMARGTQDKAADALRQAAQDLQNAAGKMPKETGPASRPGQAVEDARQRMSQARQELELSKPKAAGDAMQQAAAALRQAAREVGRSGEATQAGDPAPDGVDPGRGAGKDDIDLRFLRPFGAKYPGKSWGDIPGEIKNQIISDLKARYGEEYAKYIKLYFEQLAERK